FYGVGSGQPGPVRAGRWGSDGGHGVAADVGVDVGDAVGGLHEPIFFDTQHQRGRAGVGQSGPFDHDGDFHVFAGDDRDFVGDQIVLAAIDGALGAARGGGAVGGVIAPVGVGGYGGCAGEVFGDEQVLVFESHGGGRGDRLVPDVVGVVGAQGG